MIYFDTAKKLKIDSIIYWRKWIGHVLNDVVFKSIRYYSEMMKIMIKLCCILVYILIFKN